MEINYIHDIFNLDVNTLKEYQDDLKTKLNLDIKLDTKDIKICAGVDVSYWEKNNKTYGACSIVLLDFNTKKIIKKVSSYDVVKSEYNSGYLSIRELPLIIKTASLIPNAYKPDLFIFDGNGILHKNGIGIASHASFFLNTPTIGVSKSLSKINNLEYTKPINKNNSYSYIKIKGEIKGVAFISHKDTNPIYISPGNCIDVDSSIECIKELIDKRSKLPLPTRLADIESNKLRKIYTK